MDSLPLRDIHVPPPVAWWPPPIGWWLAALAFIGLVFAVFWGWRRMKARGALRREAMKELDRLCRDSVLPMGEKLRQLSILLRRVALSVHTREEVAGLTGAEWLRWLDGRLADGRFIEGPGKWLADAPYRPETPAGAEVDSVFALCRDWLDAVLKPR